MTRESAPPDALIRFVASPDGVVTADVDEKLPGRGVWVAARRETVDKARASNAFRRGLKRDAAAPDDLSDRVARALTARISEGFSHARRAGVFVNGFDAVRAALAEGRVALRAEAADGAANGREKLDASAHAAGFAGPVFGLFDAKRLGLVTGRDNVVHGALLNGGLAARIVRDVEKLRGFTDLVPAAWSSGSYAACDGEVRVTG